MNRLNTLQKDQQWLDEEPDTEMSLSHWILFQLGLQLSHRFTRLGHLVDLEHAILCQHLSVLLTPDSHISKPGLLTNLGSSHLRRFELLGQVSDLNKGINRHLQAFRRTPPSDPDRPLWLTNLGMAYWIRYDRFHNLGDLNKCIDCLSEAVPDIPDDRVEKLSVIFKLGDAYSSRFERIGDRLDLERAIEYDSQGLALTPTGHKDKARRLASLGTLHSIRFKSFGDIQDAEKAVDLQSQAISPSLGDKTVHSNVLNDLGNTYRYRFEHLGDLADVQQAIKHLHQAALLCPNDHGVLVNLGVSHFTRFESLGGVEDLEQAIEYFTRAHNLVPDDHLAKPEILGHLGDAYTSLFVRRGMLEDVEKAISHQDRAVSLTPENHATKPRLFNNLAATYNARFERIGELGDLHKSLDCFVRAVLFTPDGHADKPVRLYNLGIAYRCRFQRLSALEDIDKAVECQLQAIHLTPDGHADKPGLLDNLGISYTCRFGHLGELQDLGRAINVQRQAVQLTPNGHAQNPRLFGSLGRSYRLRFVTLGNPSDLEEAICYQTQANALAPDDHAEKAIYVANLGTSYRHRFDLRGEVSDIEKAINLQLQSVSLIPEAHPQTPNFLHGLADSYSSRFLRLKELTDLDEALKSQRQAVDLLPDDHVDKLSLLTALGKMYMYRFEDQKSPADLLIANVSFWKASQFNVGDSSVRFDAARLWAQTSLVLGISPLEGYQRTIELMPHFVWLGTTVSQRYKNLERVGGLVMEAASAAISSQSYDCALEWLEEGRTIVWNQILQLRTPFEDLSAVDPALARQLKEVGSALEHASSRSNPEYRPERLDASLEQEAQYHRRLAFEWDRLIGAAREITGFQDFMRPFRARILMSAAQTGPIVVVNVHSIRCDALVILPNNEDIAHIPLEGFSPKTAFDARTQLLSLVGHRGFRAGGFMRRNRSIKPTEQFKQMLATLWTRVVKPVLDFLGYTKTRSADALPHVVWCTTGALSFLPLHAAGCYDGSQPNAFDLVVSSYTPTLRALLSRQPQVPSSRVKVLAVGQEHTRGLCDLPNTVKELETVKKYLEPDRYLQLDGSTATVDAVLNAMEEYDWVHLACHASQNQSDPGKSAFHLHDGNLVLSAITKREFKNKGLAFLSACQTAAGDEKLPDEVVHLAAGMMVAGYPSVIATMWSIFDADGPEIAGHVYADLLKDGKNDYTGASRALHMAVMRLRNQVGVDSFDRWVPFIHLGQ